MEYAREYGTPISVINLSSTLNYCLQALLWCMFQAFHWLRLLRKILSHKSP
jgi:hypothetical protein